MVRNLSIAFALIVTLLVSGCGPSVDLSKAETLSGVWVVDAEESKKLQATVANPLDAKALEVLIEMARFDLDFTAKTFVEGFQAGVQHRDPFTFALKDGKIYMVEVEPTFPPVRTFIWSKHGDDKLQMVIESEGVADSPLVWRRQ